MFVGLTFWHYSAGPFRVDQSSGEVSYVSKKEIPIQSWIQAIGYPAAALVTFIWTIYRWVN